MTAATEHRDHLVILDVGHGNCAVLVLSDWTVVIDAGPKIWLEKFLRSSQITVVNEFFLSHPDRDHIAGLVQLLASRKVTVQRVWLNENVDKDTSLWEDLLYELEAAHNAETLVLMREVTAESSGRCRMRDVEIQVLHPSAEFLSYYQHRNHPHGVRLSSHSVNVVVRVVRGEKPAALFFGDLDKQGLDELCSRGVDLATPIAVFPHHGGGTGSRDMVSFVNDLCAAVRPATAVFSIGRGTHGTPDPGIIAALLERLPDARVVCTQLSAHCADAVPKEDPQHLVSLSARGREQRSCCAGSVVVYLDNMDVIPLDEEHGAFVERAAPTALCRNRPAG